GDGGAGLGGLALGGLRIGRAGVFAGAGGVEIASEPTGGAGFLGVAGHPDVGAAEVGAVVVGVSDGVEDAHQAGVVELLEAGAARVEAEVVGDLQGGVFGDAEAWADAVIVVVSDGDDGVEAVVAAGELDDDQD